jgi:hypothetical protein
VEALGCAPGTTATYALTATATQSVVELRAGGSTLTATVHLHDLRHLPGGLCARMLHVAPVGGDHALPPLVLLHSPSGSVEEVLELHLGQESSNRRPPAAPAGGGAAASDAPAAVEVGEHGDIGDHGAFGEGGPGGQGHALTHRLLLRGVVDLLSLRLHGDGVPLDAAPHRRALRDSGSGSTSSSSSDYNTTAVFNYTAVHRGAVGPSRATYVATRAGRGLGQSTTHRDRDPAEQDVWVYRREAATGPPPHAAGRMPHSHSHVRTLVSSEHVVSFGSGSDASGVGGVSGPRGRGTELPSRSQGGRLVRVTARGVAHLYGAAASAASTAPVHSLGRRGAEGAAGWEGEEGGVRGPRRTLDAGPGLLLHEGVMVEDTVLEWMGGYNGVGPQALSEPAAVTAAKGSAARLVEEGAATAHASGCGAGLGASDSETVIARCLAQSLEASSLEWAAWGLAAVRGPSAGAGADPLGSWSDAVAARAGARRLVRTGALDPAAAQDDMWRCVRVCAYVGACATLSACKRVRQSGCAPEEWS